MTISESDLVRFKNAFLGARVAQDTPLLGKATPLPPVIKSSQRVLQVLKQLDDDLDQVIQDLEGKRTGKKYGLVTVKAKSKSSIAKVQESIGPQLDLDALASVLTGKGASEVAAIQKKLTDAEAALAKASKEEFDDQIAKQGDRNGKATLHGQAAVFCLSKGVVDETEGEKHIRELAKTFAAQLGTTADAVIGASAADLRAAWVDRVYVASKLHAKRTAFLEVAKRDGKPYDDDELNAVRDARDHEKTLQNIVTDLAAIRVDGLTKDSELRTFLENLQAAKLHDSSVLNLDRPSKYTAGGVETKSFTPDIPSWPKGREVKFEGNKRYTDRVAAALDDIAKTDAGKELLLAIAATGKDTTIVAPSVASVQRTDDKGNPIFSNSGGPQKVALDTENPIAGEDATDDKIASEPWRVRDPAVALYHEMIHSLIGSKDGETWKPPSDTSYELGITHMGEITELRIVGIDYEHTTKDGKKYVFPFSDPKYNPLTENQYRIALAKLRGEKEAYLRPSYANIKGQIPLQDSKVKV